MARAGLGGKILVPCQLFSPRPVPLLSGDVRIDGGSKTGRTILASAAQHQPCGLNPSLSPACLGFPSQEPVSNLEWPSQDWLLRLIMKVSS